MTDESEKIGLTLGERLALEAEALAMRRTTSMRWRALIEPLIERSAARNESAARFARREGVPQPAHADHVEPDDELLGIEPGRPLPAATRDALRAIVGSEVELARVHVDAHADAFARRQRAAAVTVGDQIYFRAGAFAPQEPAGFALIAHEVTHVVQGRRPGSAWRRATQAGVDAEERLAHGRERAALRPEVSPLVGSRPDVAATLGEQRSRPQPAPVPVEAAHNRPMRADIDRAPIDAPAPPSAANPNLDVLRRTLFRDLMNQIRVEYERGA